MNKLQKLNRKTVKLSTPIGLIAVGLMLAIGFMIWGADDALEELPATETVSEEAPAGVLEDDFYALTEADCTSVEIYDPVEQTCYYECETDEECAAIEAQIDAELSGFFADVELGSFQEGERPESTEGIATFTVSGGDLLDRTIASERDLEVWDLFRLVTPPDMLSGDIVAYETYEDAQDDTAAYVYPDESDATRWILGVNHDAMYVDGSLERAEAARTMIHEMAHILTLRDSEVTLAVDETACTTIYVQEGCAEGDSYLAAFNQRFWEPIRGVWPGVEASEDALFDFYQSNQDQFVSDYAATNLGEDIAESFTSFVVQGRSSGTEIKDQKINFFYDYEELEQLRSVIRRNLAI